MKSEPTRGQYQEFLDLAPFCLGERIRCFITVLFLKPRGSQTRLLFSWQVLSFFFFLATQHVGSLFSGQGWTCDPRIGSGSLNPWTPRGVVWATSRVLLWCFFPRRRVYKFCNMLAYFIEKGRRTSPRISYRTYLVGHRQQLKERTIQISTR